MGSSSAHVLGAAVWLKKHFEEGEDFSLHCWLNPDAVLSTVGISKQLRAVLHAASGVCDTLSKKPARCMYFDLPIPSDAVEYEDGSSAVEHDRSAPIYIPITGTCIDCCGALLWILSEQASVSESIAIGEASELLDAMLTVLGPGLLHDASDVWRHPSVSGALIDEVCARYARTFGTSPPRELRADSCGLAVAGTRATLRPVSAKVMRQADALGRQIDLRRSRSHSHSPTKPLGSSPGFAGQRLRGSPGTVSSTATPSPATSGSDAGLRAREHRPVSNTINTRSPPFSPANDQRTIFNDTPLSAASRASVLPGSLPPALQHHDGGGGSATRGGATGRVGAGVVSPPKLSARLEGSPNTHVSPSPAMPASNLSGSSPSKLGQLPQPQQQRSASRGHTRIRSLHLREADATLAGSALAAHAVLLTTASPQAATRQFAFSADDAHTDGKGAIAERGSRDGPPSRSSSVSSRVRLHTLSPGLPLQPFSPSVAAGWSHGAGVDVNSNGHQQLRSDGPKRPMYGASGALQSPYERLLEKELSSLQIHAAALIRQDVPDASVVGSAALLFTSSAAVHEPYVLYQRLQHGDMTSDVIASVLTAHSADIQPMLQVSNGIATFGTGWHRYGLQVHESAAAATNYGESLAAELKTQPPNGGFAATDVSPSRSPQMRVQRHDSTLYERVLAAAKATAPVLSMATPLLNANLAAGSSHSVFEWSTTTASSQERVLALPSSSSVAAVAAARLINLPTALPDIDAVHAVVGDTNHFGARLLPTNIDAIHNGLVLFLAFCPLEQADDSNGRSGVIEDEGPAVVCIGLLISLFNEPLSGRSIASSNSAHIAPSTADEIEDQLSNCVWTVASISNTIAIGSILSSSNDDMAASTVTVKRTSSAVAHKRVVSSASSRSPFKLSSVATPASTPAMSDGRNHSSLQKTRVASNLRDALSVVVHPPLDDVAAAHRGGSPSWAAASGTPQGLASRTAARAAHWQAKEQELAMQHHHQHSSSGGASVAGSVVLTRSPTATTLGSSAAHASSHSDDAAAAAGFNRNERVTRAAPLPSSSSSASSVVTSPERPVLPSHQHSATPGHAEYHQPAILESMIAAAIAQHDAFETSAFRHDAAQQQRRSNAKSRPRGISAGGREIAQVPMPQGRSPPQLPNRHAPASSDAQRGNPSTPRSGARLSMSTLSSAARAARAAAAPSASPNAQQVTSASPLKRPSAHMHVAVERRSPGSSTAAMEALTPPVRPELDVAAGSASGPIPTPGHAPVVQTAPSMRPGVIRGGRVASAHDSPVQSSTASASPAQAGIADAGPTAIAGASASSSTTEPHQPAPTHTSHPVASPEGARSRSRTPTRPGAHSEDTFAPVFQAIVASTASRPPSRASTQPPTPVRLNSSTGRASHEHGSSDADASGSNAFSFADSIGVGAVLVQRFSGSSGDHENETNEVADSQTEYDTDAPWPHAQAMAQAQQRLPLPSPSAAVVHDLLKDSPHASKAPFSHTAAGVVGNNGQHRSTGDDLQATASTSGTSKAASPPAPYEISSRFRG